MLDFLKRTEVKLLIGAWLLSDLVLYVLQSTRTNGFTRQGLSAEVAAALENPLTAGLVGVVSFGISLLAYYLLAYIIDAVVRESGPKQTKLVFKLLIALALINSLAGYIGVVLVLLGNAALLGLFTGLYGLLSIGLLIFSVIWVKDIYNVSWVRSLFGQILAAIIYSAIVLLLTGIIMTPVVLALVASSA